MSDKERRIAAESLIRLSENPDGIRFLRGVEKDFDAAMQGLLYAEPDKIHTAQGEARALHEQLKKFATARREIEAGNTHA